MKLKYKFKYPKIVFALSLILPFLGAAPWFFGGEPGPHPRNLDRDHDQGGQTPELWQAWFSRGRQSPDQHPAAFHRLQALEQKGRLPLARPIFSTAQAQFKPLANLPFAPPGPPSCDWTELGPAPENDSFYGNVSGRVTSLALDLTHDPAGNTLYVGTAYGGLWKTTNGLAAVPTFVPVSDQTQSLAMGSLALDTSGGQTILYAGTGELNMAGDSYYGVGILKSVDGGTNWTLASTANSGAITFLGLACSKILVDPSSPTTVLAAMGFACCHDGVTNLNQGLYRSTDSGASWTQVSTVTGQAIVGHSFTDVIYDGSATFYAAVRFQGVYYSIDHGLSWTQLPSPFPSTTAPNTTNFARATLAFRGGNLWCLASDSGGNPSAPGTGDTGLSQSNDGGNTWNPIILPSSGINLFDAGYGAQGTYDQYVAAPPGAASLLVAGIDVFSTSSVNGTSTSWTNRTTSYSNGKSHPDQHAVAFVNANSWYIGNDGGVWTTANAGTNFKDINNNLGTLQFYSISADPSAPGAFLGGTQDNGLPYTNAPSSWTEEVGGDGGYTDVNAAIFGQFYGEAFGIGLYRVDNFGANFTTVVNKTTITTDNAAILVPYKVIPGTSPQVVYGTSRIWDGPGNASNGAGWVTISNYLTGNNSGAVISLDVAPSNSNYIYATTDDGAATPIYQVYSNGGGSTWSNISTGLPNTNPLVGITVDPVTPTKAYVGVQGFVGAPGSGHVFETTNGGGSWTDITGTLPDAPVNSILVDPQFPGDVYVANDVGVFATQNNGATWARMGALLPDSTVLQIKMSTTCPRVIVAGTHGRGAWSICPLDYYCPPTPTPTATNTPTSTPTISYTPTNTPTGTLMPTLTPTPASYAAAPPVLFPNPYPDPKNLGAPSQFQLTLSAASDVNVRIFTVVSRKVQDENFPRVPAGPATLTLDLKDKAGTPLANGVYFVAVDTNQNHYILKLLILR